MEFARWENSTAGRYYEVRIEHDLFGVVVVRCWGSQCSRLGGMQCDPCASEQEARQVAQDIHKRRTQRHYRLRCSTIAGVA